MRVQDADAHTSLPCLWVLAGVLNYRLCDREYDCEGCDLFRALRGGQAQPECSPGGAADGRAVAPGTAGPRMAADSTAQYFCRLIGGCTLRFDRYYSAGHLWVDSWPGDRVSLGLDGHVLRVLHPVDDVLPPRVGMWLKRGVACGWIVRGRRGMPLVAPLSGEVVDVNARYVETLSGTDRNGAGDVWLLQLAAHESPADVPELARGEEALVRYLRDIRLIKHHLREAGADSSPETVGVALSDGGIPELDLERVLGPERYEALVEELFSAQI